MKKILLLGASGSIGKSVLKVLRKYPSKFKLVGITAYSKTSSILKIAKEFNIKNYAISSTDLMIINGKKCESNFSDCNSYMVNNVDFDIVINALVGSTGFRPTVDAIRREKIIALANKETIVAYGEIINRLLKKYKKAEIRPVDSEHSALWQLLSGVDRKNLKRIIITASGGVTFKTGKQDLEIEDIMAHPVWNMGKKVTVDSSTMMNKGLEIIEASFLFNIEPKKISVLIHPQSIIHGMIEMKDGTMISHMAYPDMVLPIEYAMFYPDRPKERIIKSIDFNAYSSLSFFEPDFKRFPALDLAYKCLIKGKTYTAVFSKANEIAVKRFLDGEIKFRDIVSITDKVLKMHKPINILTEQSIMNAEKWAQEKALKVRV